MSRWAANEPEVVIMEEPRLSISAGLFAQGAQKQAPDHQRMYLEAPTFQFQAPARREQPSASAL